MSSSDVGLVIFLVVLVLITVLSVVVALWFRRRVGTRYRAEGLIECGLRVVTGEVPGLSKRWRHGLARLEGNALVFGQGRLGTCVVVLRTPLTSVFEDPSNGTARRSRASGSL